MRVLRTAASITFITAMALLYVHQQIELVKVSYAIECRERKLKDMLDRREGLGYNINNLQDPSRMEKVLLSRNIDIAFPKRANVLTSAGMTSHMEAEDRLRSASVEKKVNLLGFFDFLSQSKEAQARER